MNKPHNDPKLIKELREKSGAGLMDCKKALCTTNGNMEEAIKWLNEHRSWWDGIIY